jgi:hypothetical protein
MIGVAVKITDRCDKYCSHCCENSLPLGKSMPFFVLERVIKKISLTADRFGITGGEPVLYQDGKHNFLDIIELCKKYNCIPTVMCGGAYPSIEYKDIFYKLIAPYKIPFTLSFNLFKPNPEQLFKTAYKYITVHNYVCDIFCVYHEDNEFETRQRLANLCKSMHIYARIFYGHISQTGRAVDLDFFKRVKLVNRCSSNIEKILFVDMNGKVNPCCEINRMGFPGWNAPHYTCPFEKILKKSNEYCRYCPSFNGVIPLPHQ